MGLIWLSEDEWRPRAAAHEARVDALVAAHLERRRLGDKHAVEDFLFDYYGFSPARLRRWHPGAGVALEGAAGDPIAGWKHMRVVERELVAEATNNVAPTPRGRPAPDALVAEATNDVVSTPRAQQAPGPLVAETTDNVASTTSTGDAAPRAALVAEATNDVVSTPRRQQAPGPLFAETTNDVASTTRTADAAARGAAGGTAAGVALDADAFLAARGKAVGFVRRLLAATLERELHTGCFGLHEWAMVYRQPQERRHGGLPLRLGADGTDAVLEASTLRCTHFDATRFFTPEGLARNTQSPTREGMIDHEQPGCLHAGMDVYRWAYKLAPAVPSELTADAFELAREIRTLDMQASPYDLRALGYEPVPIETPEGRREYATRQREFGERANLLRRRLLGAITQLDSVAAGSAAAPVSHLQPAAT